VNRLSLPDTSGTCPEISGFCAKAGDHRHDQQGFDARVKMAMAANPMENVTITRHDYTSHGEYRAHVEGHSHIGRLTWTQEDGIRSADHTIVPPEIGGRGIAAMLVEDLVADAREQGFKVKPLCSYVVRAFQKHPEWADIAA